MSRVSRLRGLSALNSPPSPLFLLRTPSFKRCFQTMDLQSPTEAGLTYTLLTPELAEATASCIAETFCQRDEAFTWALNLKRHHWHSLIIPFIERAANSSRPLSVVALHAATGRVSGAAIVEDWNTPRPLAYRGEHLLPEWWPVRSIFAELHTRYDALEAPSREKGHTLRALYFSGVHPDFRGGGGGGQAQQPQSQASQQHPLSPLPRHTVIKGLWNATVEAGRGNGYTTITAQVTSEASRKMLSGELGFLEVASVPFAQYSVPEQQQQQQQQEGGGRGGAGGGHYTGLVFKELAQRGPNARLSIHKRSIPSDLY